MLTGCISRQVPTGTCNTVQHNTQQGRAAIVSGQCAWQEVLSSRAGLGVGTPFPTARTHLS
jgi:hypothetical protein